MYYALVIFGIVLLWVLKTHMKWRQEILNHVEKIQGPKAYPFIGTLHLFFGAKRSDVYKIIASTAEQYKPFYRTWAKSTPEVNIMKPEHIEIVLRSSVLITKGKVYEFIRPWLGEGLLTSTDLFKVLKGLTYEYGPLYRTWARTSPEINIMKPEHLEMVMKSSTLITKGKIYDFMFPWLGDGLLISTGSKWFQRRKMITPAFHFKILEHYMEVFVEKSKQLVNILEDKSNGKIFDIYPYITHCALDIICETAMGVSVNAMSDVTENGYVDSLYRASELIIRRRFTPWYHSDIYYLFPEGREFQRHLNVLHGFTSKVIGDRKKILKENPISKINPSFDDMLVSSKKRLSFLDLLLSANETIPDRDIREEVDTFMFEGHDTTTAGICWSLFLIGNHPDVQEKVYEELKAVLGDNKCPESISDLNDLKYLECCIKEALRIYPSVPFISRKVTEDIVIDGYKIPKGVYCNLHLHKVHRDPEIYPDPMKFDPDRFLPENTAKRHPYAYVPFSAGPRNCIGQKFAMYEEKTMLSAILMSYKIKTIDSQSSVNELAELIMRPEQGVRIRLEKRSK